jgi:hypothetical protein
MRLLMAILCGLGLFAASPAIARATLQNDWHIRNYRVTLRVGRDAGGAPSATLKVLERGRVVYTMANAELRLNPPGFFLPAAGGGGSDAGSGPPYRVGDDLLGLGGPTLVVQGFSRGAHCCYDVTILYLGDHFRAMPTIPLFDVETVKFRPGPGHGPLAMTTYDSSFAYWRGPFALASAPPVVFGFDRREHRYAPSASLMVAPLPASSGMEAAKTAARAAQAQSGATTQPFAPRELTKPILDMIYTGHLKEARDFLVAAWAGGADEREDYWSDLTGCQLRLSPFWPTVAQLNGLSAEKPVGRCPRV